MTNNQIMFSSLYENPVIAGIMATEIETACDDRLVAYLLRDRLDDSAIELASVESAPSLPPRQIELAAVASLPHVPPRGQIEFAAVASVPAIPPRA